jgi:Sec-independent protein translocase protein TatA
MGGDLGAAIQNFRKAMSEGSDTETDANRKLNQPGDDNTGPKA